MKTIFISGGSTGIGAACVRMFNSRGWNVAFMDVNTEAAETLVSTLEAPQSVLFISGSITERADIHRAVVAAKERFGGLDSVFANAGIHRRNTLLDISDEELELVIDTNIYGTVNTLRETVPLLLERGSGSVVINASDQWFVGKAHSFAYGLSKGALGQITRSLSVDLAPQGIRVNAVCPGTIHTPLVDNLFEKCSKSSDKSIEELWQDENSLYSRGKVGQPEEVAELVYFLASDASSFCTGGHYLVDGGLVAGR